MRECEVEVGVCKYAREKYSAQTLKFTSPGRRGVPDRIIIFPSGNLIFIEFKAPGRKPTDAQVREIGRLTEYGQQVYVVDDIDRGQAIIDLAAWKGYKYAHAG